MTVTTQASQQIFIGDGTNKIFPYSFKIPSAQVAYLYLIEDDESETLIASSQYSLSGLNNDAGGNLTYPLSGAALAADRQIRLVRTVPYTQELDIRNQTGFLPEVVEAGLDALEMQVQQIQDRPGIGPPAADQLYQPAMPTVPKMSVGRKLQERLSFFEIGAVDGDNDTNAPGNWEKIQAALDYLYDQRGGVLYGTEAGVVYRYRGAPLQIKRGVSIHGSAPGWHTQYVSGPTNFTPFGLCLKLGTGANHRMVEVVNTDAGVDGRTHVFLWRVFFDGHRSTDQNPTVRDINTSGDAIALRGARYVHILECGIARSAGRAIICETVGGFLCNNLDIRANAIVSNFQGCSLTAGDSVFTGNQVGYNGAEGIVAVAYGLIGSNRIWNNVGHGINDLSTKEPCKIHGNTIYDNQKCNVLISSTVLHASVQGNDILRANRSQSATVTDQANVYMGATGEGHNITGNVIGDNALFSADADKNTVAVPVTISIASPAVIAWTGHGLTAKDAVFFTTTGALPTGISPNVTYYVVNPTANDFQIALGPDRTPINTSGTQSGVHSARKMFRCEYGVYISQAGTVVNLDGNVYFGHRISDITSAADTNILWHGYSGGTRFSHPGFRLLGGIDFNSNFARNMSAASFGTQTVVTSAPSGVLAAAGTALVALDIDAGATITDITTTQLGVFPLIIVRNIDPLDVTFTHNTAKLRLKGGVNYVLKQNNATMFFQVSAGIWQQID